VILQQPQEFRLKTDSLVVLLLIFDVLPDSLHLGLAHRDPEISTLPFKPPTLPPFFMNPSHTILGTEEDVKTQGCITGGLQEPLLGGRGLAQNFWGKSRHWIVTLN
jgi:hypothetical protein